MKVTLVGHASVIIETADLRIWADPWTHGKAFNESWTLIAPAELPAAALDEIDYLWISHEHPDHFHVPTLRALPDSFKQRVTVLFQENNSDKMLAALRRLGFPKSMTLPHRKKVALSRLTSAYCYQVGQMDSALAVQAEGECVFDVNDAELNTRDCRLIRRDLGAVDVVLNQFSIAGYGGLDDAKRHLSELATRILSSVSENHRDLQARVTIPIASFIYFSAADNRYVNEFANSPQAVFEHLQSQNQECVVLYHGDDYTVGATHDSAAALSRWASVYDRLDQLPYDPCSAVPIEDIEQAFHARVREFREHYPARLLRRLGPVTVRVPDLGRTISFCIPDDRFEVVDAEPDLEVNSQPLEFTFAQPFGLQTLGVSARLRLRRSSRNWTLHRILFSLNNAEIYLRPRYLFTRRNLKFIRSRLRGGLNQLTYQLARMR